MRFITSTSNDPYLNLATEEYFLRNSTEELFFIYINEPCIVVGKHQNLLAEINLRFALDHNIKLARRISGGGTVYQDYNNLNFSFIHNCPNLEQVNFSHFTQPILEALKEIGLDVEFSGRNDLLLDSKKISGNAMHIFKTRVLSHGTLLFNSDLQHLSSALKVTPDKYTDKAIKSVRSKVTNISDYLNPKMSMDQFHDSILKSIITKSLNPDIHPVDDAESAAINKLSKEKFATWDWNMGYSPNYQYKGNYSVPEETVHYELKIEKGIIRDVQYDTDCAQKHPHLLHLFEILLNEKHDFRHLFNLVQGDKKLNELKAFDAAEFCNSLF